MGFTLLELSISMAILSIISLLTLAVTNSTTSASVVAGAKEGVQASLRDALSEMTNELQLAAKRSNAGLVPPLQALRLVSATEVVFQVPVDSNGMVWSQPITYRFVYEDTGLGANGNNGRLETGEDANNDHALTRCIQRIQGTNRRALGAANEIRNVQFALNAANDILSITVTATKAINNRRHDLVTVTAASQVYLLN
jgi:prepilin-type N-terminal cleavage/methylation domain-containing protein